MWDNYTFQAYLKSIGKLELWDRIIYPAMKQGILCVLLASQETIPVRKNCFELYGADFMLSEDFIPWLIEINSCPCMAPTTSVTARMCWQCLYDCIKVVIDRRDNPKADTGMFELIYQQSKSLLTSTFVKGMDAVISGRKFGKEATEWPKPIIASKSKGKLSSGSEGSLVQPPKLLLKDVETPIGEQKTVSKFNFTDLVQRLRMKDANRPSPVTTAYGTTLGTIESTTPAHSSSTNRVPPYMDRKEFEQLKRNTIVPASPTSSSSKKKSGTFEEKKRTTDSGEKGAAEKELEKEAQGSSANSDAESSTSSTSKTRRKHAGGYRPNSNNVKRKKSGFKGLTLNQISAIEAANFKLVSLEANAKELRLKNNNGPNNKSGNEQEGSSSSSTSSNRRNASDQKTS
jgi:hypothetical protein